MSEQTIVEICVEDIESALVAERGGADRIELCDNLSVGGTTPGAGTIAEACRRLKVPVHVLVRPRGGDFVHSPAELAAMRFDIETARSLGAAGVVMGVLRPDSTIDVDTTAELIALARPMSVTFHKAFDETPAPEIALETLIALGVDRVLTSGGCPTAIEGMLMLCRLVGRARGRITILASGRLSLETLRAVIEQTGVREVHLGSAACASGARGVQAENVRAIVERVRGIA